VAPDRAGRVNGTPPGYGALIRLAVPVILANAAAPLLGLADTAVIGHTGDAAAMGAIALGTLIFSFLSWGFAFLRMGTTGFVAQAAGAGDRVEVRAALARALLTAMTIGVLLIVLQWPLRAVALAVFGATAAVEQGVALYFHARIWSAPATLGLYALLGTLIGLGRMRALLALQILLNGLNLILDLWFVLGLGWGVPGVALGTVLAEWAAFAAGLFLVLRVIRPHPTERVPMWSWPDIFVRRHWRRMVSTNTDILWRTLALLAGFAWFTNQGARFGDATLAANHILLQFTTLSAFFLDGFAFVLEAQVGHAAGAGQVDRFRVTAWRATLLAGATAMLLALAIAGLGPWFVQRLTTIAAVQELALGHLPWAALYVVCSFPAFQLDGIFVGTSESRPMRDATLVALLIFLGASWVAVERWANDGLWLAFVGFVIARGGVLGVYLPRLTRRLRLESMKS
jgi:MATE family multidrug resistance protein